MNYQSMHDPETPKDGGANGVNGSGSVGGGSPDGDPFRLIKGNNWWSGEYLEVDSIYFLRAWLDSLNKAVAEMQAAGYTLVDIRPVNDYREYHAPGAINVPLYRDSASPTRDPPRHGSRQQAGD